MENLKAIILGIIQGLTEFLPLSSSGHLVIFQKLVGFEIHDVYFNVALHFGTLLAVLTVYFKSFTRLSLGLLNFSDLKGSAVERNFFYSICIATLPAAFVGWFFNQKINVFFSDLKIVGLLLCVTGVFLFFSKEKKGHSFLSSNKMFPSISILKALAIGLAQAFAILPGISRSGLTISVGLSLGLSAKGASLFSFSLSVPIIMGAFLFEIQKHSLTLLELKIIGTGLIVSYLSGLIGLSLLIRFLKGGYFKYFSYYLWVLGGLTFILSF